MSSLLMESSPMSRDQVSLATPSLSTYRSQLYSHQRSHSNQLTYTTLPQPILASKFSQQQPSILSSFSSLPKKDDQETQNFQTPNSASIKSDLKVIDKPFEEFFRDMSQRRSQTRTSRIYTFEEMKAEPNSHTKAANKEQIQTTNSIKNVFNSAKEIKEEISSTSQQSATPSPLLLQFGNMDLRKRASIMPIRPVEINFDNKIQTKGGSKFRNLKIEDNLEVQNTNDSDQDKDSNDSSPVERRVKSNRPIMGDFYNDNQNDEEEDLVSIDGDCDDDTNEGSVSASDNIIVEVKSTRNISLKSILKKPSSQLKYHNFGEENKNKVGENYNQQNISSINNGEAKQMQLIHLRSNSLTILPSQLNINSLLEQQSSTSSYWLAQSKQQQSPFISNTPTSNNILGSRDLNQQFQSLSSSYQPNKDYQFTSFVTPLLEKPSSGVFTPTVAGGRVQMQRSQSLTGMTKKVQFLIQDDISQQNYQSSFSDIYSLQSPQLQSFNSSPSIFSNYTASTPSQSSKNSFGSQNNILPINSSNQRIRKSNSFNKFYSAFKQNLSTSKSDLFSSPQLKSSSNIVHNHNNSINSTASTTPSLNSFSQYSSLQTANAQLPTSNSNSSSASSTPLASQQKISAMISPQSAQFSNDRKNPISQNLLHSVFKDMKLTKNTKVYMDNKVNKPSLNCNSPSVKVNTPSAFSLNSPSSKQNDIYQMRRAPSTEIIFRTSNA